MRGPQVCRTVGRRGQVTLLLKNPDQPVQEANLKGITISSHVSKLEPTAFYALGSAIYERALGGACLVGGMRGVPLQEVVRTVHMKLDFTRLHHRVVDVLITDLVKFFDVITQDVHPIMGARLSVGEASHLATHTEGLSYTLPLALGFQYRGAAPGNPPRYHPRGPCGRDGGSPVSALHGHGIPRFRGTPFSLSGAHGWTTQQSS